jgi:predicted nuclease of restriction endonuclease-like (RecB) superfamily
MTVPNRNARQFYEEEAIKGGWSVRQLDRQISTQFYERLSGSKRKGELNLLAFHILLQCCG